MKGRRVVSSNTGAKSKKKKRSKPKDKKIAESNPNEDIEEDVAVKDVGAAGTNDADWDPCGEEPVEAEKAPEITSVPVPVINADIMAVNDTPIDVDINTDNDDLEIVEGVVLKEEVKVEVEAPEDGTDSSEEGEIAEN